MKVASSCDVEISSTNAKADVMIFPCHAESISIANLKVLFSQILKKIYIHVDSMTEYLGHILKNLKFHQVRTVYLHPNGLSSA